MAGPQSITINEDITRRQSEMLDQMTALGMIPYRPLNGAIVIVIASGVITSVDVSQTVTTKTLADEIQDQHGADWTAP